MGKQPMKRHSALMNTAAGLVVGLGALAVATAALAHDHEHGWKRKGPPFVPPGHVYYSRPVVYAPRPVVIYPAYPAAIIYEREPVYYYSAPQPGLNINLNMPLR